MRLQRVFLLAILCLGAAALGGLFLALRSYQVFAEQALVAEVRCEAAPAGSSHQFLLRLRQIRGGRQDSWQEFPMHGEQWMVSGEILKWHPWLNWLGLRSCHKLTRLSSRYLQARDELSRSRSAYDLNAGTTRLWRWLHRMGNRLPGVEAVYGNAAYTPARPGGRWGVYATLSGYLIKLLNGRSQPFSP